MIKPGTVCMIRGVPSGKPGYEFNGTIVRAEKVKARPEGVGNVWYINPPLTSVREKTIYTGCAEKWLYPLDDFEDELNREALDEVLELSLIHI